MEDEQLHSKRHVQVGDEHLGLKRCGLGRNGAFGLEGTWLELVLPWLG